MTHICYKAREAIKIAYAKGYRVQSDGSVISPRFIKLKLQKDFANRFKFNVSIGNGKRFPVMVHRLAAFQKFGQASLIPDINVSHLNGNVSDNSPKNIILV